ncbi:BTB/POZ domain-containing protein At3g19850 [Linum grandiflorum]
MRWYLDEDGFPKRGLTTKSEMDSLLKNLESIKDWTPSEAEDFDDVFDETLLPLPIQRSNEIKQSQENYATDQTKLNPMSESNEDFQGETKLLDTPVIHYYRLLYSPAAMLIQPSDDDDVAIHVNSQETFFLNQRIVCSYMGMLRNIIQQESQIRISRIEIDSFPGGPAAFELVAGFCRGGALTLSAANVSLLHCAAVYLGMTEAVSTGNLLKQTEHFLRGISSWSLPNVVSSLESCEPFFSYAKSLGLVEKLVSRVIAKIATSSPDTSSDCSSTSADDVTWNSDSSSPNSKQGRKNNRVVRVEWWFDQLVKLSPRVIEMLVKNFGAHNSTLTCFLLHYLKNKTPDYVRHSKTKSGPTSRDNRSTYSGLADTTIQGVTTSTMSLSYRTLMWVLRIISGFNPTKGSKRELERMIGELLDQASLDDLLVTGHNGDHVRSVYDVDLVIRLVGVFVVYHHHQSQKMKRVVKLLDEYLREISPDHNLKMAKFMEVVESLPMAARESFDGVYRAIDIYLETHRSLSMEERSRLCGCLNFEKLSMEACKEMAKNPKIPPTISVQALMSKRSTIPNSIGRGSSTPSRMKLVNGDVYGYSCSPSTKGRIDQTRNNESDMDIEIEMNVVKMQERVVELERNCRKLKKEMSKMGKQHHGDGGGGLNKLMSLPSSCGKNMGWICY